MAYCVQCGAAYDAAATRFCPRCGRQVGDNSPLATGAKAPGGPSGEGRRFGSALFGGDPNWSVSFRAWQFNERVIAGATVFLFVAMLVPWWSISFGPVSFSIDGFHGWGWFTFVGFLGALALLCARLVSVGGRPLLTLPVPLGQAYAIFGGLDLLGVALYLILTVRHLGFGNVSAGVFMALVAGVVTVVGAADPWTNRQATVRAAPARRPAETVDPFAVPPSNIPSATSSPGVSPSGVVTPPPPPHPASVEGTSGVGPATPDHVCPRCHLQNPAVNRFCEGCGMQLAGV